MFEFIKDMFKKKEPKKPETFEEAVDYVVNRIDKDTVSNPHFHFSGGMAMRNQLNLWDRDSAIHKHMLERFGLCHADDTGMLISNAAHAKKNNKEYDPEIDVVRCKRHWISMGYDPATMKELKDELESNG